MSSGSAAVLAGLAMPLAACGGSGDATETAPVIAPLATAAQATRDAGTAAVRLSFGGADTLGIGEKTLAGSVDFDRHRVEVGSGAERTIVTESALYVAEPGPPAATWRRHQLDEEPSAELAPDLLVGRLDPIRLLAFVERSADVFEEIGSEQVRGVETTVYRGTADTAILLEELVPEGHRDAVASGAASEVLVDAWVDSRNRVRRVLYDFPAANVTFGRRATVELSDFGASVNIEVPRAGAVVEGAG